MADAQPANHLPQAMPVYEKKYRTMQGDLDNAHTIVPNVALLLHLSKQTLLRRRIYK